MSLATTSPRYVYRAAPEASVFTTSFLTRTYGVPVA
jgi:hypothetical protein